MGLKKKEAAADRVSKMMMRVKAKRVAVFQRVNLRVIDPQLGQSVKAMGITRRKRDSLKEEIVNRQMEGKDIIRERRR